MHLLNNVSIKTASSRYVRVLISFVILKFCYFLEIHPALDLRKTKMIAASLANFFRLDWEQH